MAEKILVIEDDPSVAELIRYALETAGYEVIPCVEGNMAWEAVETTNPALIILDMMLPGVDGYTLVTKMAQDDKKKSIPIIVTTALAPSRNMFEKFQQVIAFMPKPFDMPELLKKMQSALKNRNISLHTVENV